MRISSIEIKNFRAFKGTPLKIDLHRTGKNLLVYGENGSGKSSLFFALKDFLECAVRRSDISQFPFRNIFCTTTDGYIKVDFADPGASRQTQSQQARLYEWSESKNETSEQLILEVNKTKGFIDYKALLATYFLQQDDDTVNIFHLLIGSILTHAENDLSRRPLGEEWKEINDGVANLNKRSPKQKEALIERIKIFNDGLRNKLAELQGEAQNILDYFGYELQVELHFGGVEYNAAKDTIEKQIVGMKVKFFGTAREDHHRFLNEAKLSAIAISIFFAALLLQPVSRLRVLALDDVLIGLDMSNRLPVLDILEQHFQEFQIFFFTYDKAWYDIVKNHIESRRAGGAWEYVEFYAATTDEHNIPIYAPARKFLERAKEHFANHDYKAAAVYARTHFEARLKKFCDKQKLRVRYRERANESQSDDFWQAIVDVRDAKNWNVKITDQLINDVQRCRYVILNPLSHADWRSVHRREVQDAIDIIEKLDAALNTIA